MKRGKFHTFLYIFFLVVLSISVIYIHSLLESTQTKLRTSLEHLYAMQALELASNTQNEINHHIHYDLVASLKKNKKLRQELSHALAMLPASFYQQAFICTKTKNGDIRYLVGKFDPKKKLRFFEKIEFDPQLIDRVYQSKHYVISKKSVNKQTQIVFVAPLIVAQKVQGAFVLSYSFSLFNEIDTLLSGIDDIFNTIVFIVILIVILLFSQEFENTKTKHEVFIDALTGAYNRHFLRKFLETADMEHYQILLLDIDHFKKVNDTYGHKAGDFILSETAALIRSEIRGNDVFIRYGGEEFLLFIHRKDKNQQLAKNIAYRIKEKIQMHEFRYEEIVLRVTVSIGVNCFPEEFPKISDAIKYADDMLYVAKRNGRNQVVSNLKKVENFKVIKQLTLFDVKRALEEKRVLCYFQPALNLKTNNFSYAQALVRIIDIDGEILPPERFLKNIEKTNLYRNINMTVLDKVFEQLPKSEVPIGINLDITDILDDEYFEYLKQKLNTHTEEKGKLRIELHITQLVASFESITKRCKELKEMGVGFSLDHFAVNSAFTLHEIFSKLPIDMINIDGAIIEETERSQTAKTIVKSILYMATNLGIDVTAEHVCSKEIFEYLSSIGIVYMEGFYISKPEESVEEFKGSLNRFKKKFNME